MKFFTSMIAALAIVAAATAQAGTISFSIDPPLSGFGATADYAGGSTPFIVAGVGVGHITAVGMPLHDGNALNCSDCKMDFQTGSFLSWSPVQMRWDGGGSISIVGGVDLDNDGILDIAPGTALMAGTFTQPVLLTKEDRPGHFMVATSAFMNVVDPDVLAFYGVQFGPYNGTFSLEMTMLVDPFTGDPIRARTAFKGYVVATPVPEPAPLAVFGAVIAAAGGFNWYRRKRRANDNRRAAI